MVTKNSLASDFITSAIVGRVGVVGAAEPDTPGDAARSLQATIASKARPRALEARQVMAAS